MSQRILFVCLGNICRSPAAEGVFRVRAPHHACDSAGTSDWHVGDPPYAPMQHAARNRGLELSDLRARQFAVSDFDRFDLIIGMDSENIAKIEALRQHGYEGGSARHSLCPGLVQHSRAVREQPGDQTPVGQISNQDQRR